MIRKIVKASNPVLRTKSKPVKRIDKKTKTLVKDLKETLLAQKDPEGVGLAAPQIGKNVRVFVMRDGEKIKTIINPKIISTEHQAPSTKHQKIMEGCLSIPHYYGPLVRPQKIKIKYQDEKAKEKIVEFKGFSAQVVQHEIDHLEGVLFIDRLLENKKPLYKLRKDKSWEEVYFSLTK